MPSLVHPFWGHTDHGHCSAAEAQLGREKSWPAGDGVLGCENAGTIEIEIVLYMKFEIAQQNSNVCILVPCAVGLDWGEGVATTGRGGVQIQCDKCDGVRQ